MAPAHPTVCGKTTARLNQGPLAQVLISASLLLSSQDQPTIRVLAQPSHRLLQLRHSGSVDAICNGCKPVHTA